MTSSPFNPPFSADINLEGLLPIDGIDVVVPEGVPAGFNLVDLLSESMASRPAWNDMATVTSQVLYNYFEQYRIAFELSRSPENISTVLKVITLKMMGLDWRSTNLTDDDYNRLLYSISLYEQNHGPQDFVRFIGYALGVPMEMIPLWTKDYEEFDPQDWIPNKNKSLWDSPPGPYYPTSHVGLLYEEFAKNVAAVDLNELRDVFYKLAPINLVLEWIATEVTLRVGPLYMSLQFFETSEDTIQTSDKVMTLLLCPLPYERSEDVLLLFPDAPQRELPVNMMVAGCEVDEEFAFTARPYVDWSPLVSAPDGGLVSVGSNQTIVGSTLNNNVAFVTEPCSDYIGWLPGQYGALINPARYGYVPNSSNPLALSWTKTNNTVIGAASWAGEFLYTLTTTNQAPIYTTGVITGTNVVTWTLALVVGSGSEYVALQRGVDSVIVDLVSGVAHPSNGVACGVEMMGDGFVTIWAVMTGGDITIYPSWGNDLIGTSTATNTIWWYNLQVENSVFPSVPFLSGATVPILHAQSTFDLGNGTQLNYPFSFALIQAMPSFAEWSLSDQTLFDFRNRLGDRIIAWISSDNLVRFQVVGSGVTTTVISPVIAYAASSLCFGFRLNSTTQTIRLYVDWWYEDLLVPIPTGFAFCNILHPHNAPVTSQWTLQRVIVNGFNQNTELPTDAVMTWLFNPPA